MRWKFTRKKQVYKAAICKRAIYNFAILIIHRNNYKIVKLLISFTHSINKQNWLNVWQFYLKPYYAATLIHYDHVFRNDNENGINKLCNWMQCFSMQLQLQFEFEMQMEMHLNKWKCICTNWNDYVLNVIWLNWAWKFDVL